MKAVIMAGGMGTRLRDVANDIPKPMFEIGGVPVVERQLRSLASYGFDEIIVVVGYLGDVIERHVLGIDDLDMKVSVLVEEKPLGTAGALYYLKDELSEDFALVFGDVLFDIDWRAFAEYHAACGSTVTLFAHPNSHPNDSDLLIVGEDGLVKGVLRKGEQRPKCYANCVNAGLYFLQSDVLDAIKSPKKTDFEADVLMGLIPEGNVYAYRSTEYVKDMGTPDRLDAVNRDYAVGIPKAKNKSRKQRCIFFDRDGTLNELDGFINSYVQLELIDGVAGAIRAVNTSPFLCVVVTNQPVIARGECSFAEMDLINQRLDVLLGENGAYLDGLYFCPHHPDAGFDGEVAALKGPCDCRKPGIALFESASRDMNIDLAESWMVGDSTVDIQAGCNAGMRTALVLSGEQGLDGRYGVKPTIVAENLAEIVEKIFDVEGWHGV